MEEIMSDQRTRTGHIAITPAGRSTNLYAFSAALQNEICDIMERMTSGDPVERAMHVLEAVVVHCTDLESMVCAGGPRYWPTLVVEIVKSWTKDPHGLFWSERVRECVRAYVADVREFEDACDPSKIELRCVEDGAQDIREWLFPERSPQPLALAHSASDGDNAPLQCTQTDILRADGLENRAGYLAELEAKGRITVVERAKGHKQPHLIQFSDPKYREKVRLSMEDYRRNGSKPSNKPTRS
jgi:hypothetical protein